MADVTTLSDRRAPTCAGYNIERLDGRTRQGRAVRELVEAFAAQVADGGPLSADQAAAVERAAVLHVIAAETRRGALFDPSLIDQCIRAENLAQRAVKALGLFPVRKREPGGLAAHLAKKGAARCR